MPPISGPTFAIFLGKLLQTVFRCVSNVIVNRCLKSSPQFAIVNPLFAIVRRSATNSGTSFEDPKLALRVAELSHVARLFAYCDCLGW